MSWNCYDCRQSIFRGWNLVLYICKLVENWVICVICIMCKCIYYIYVDTYICNIYIYIKCNAKWIIYIYRNCYIYIIIYIYRNGIYIYIETIYSCIW